jgi:hypothetical protein
LTISRPVITDGLGAVVNLLGAAAVAGAGAIVDVGEFIVGLAAEALGDNDPNETTTGNGDNPCDSVDRRATARQAEQYAEAIPQKGWSGPQDVSRHWPTVAVLAVCDTKTGNLTYYASTSGKDWKGAAQKQYLTGLPVVVVPPSDVSPAGAENVLRAVQAACWYSWRSPPRRSRRWMRSGVTMPGSVIGWGSGRSGLALAMPLCGRCEL